MRLLSPRFRRFIIVGGIGTMIDFTLFAIMHLTAELPLIPSNIISYGTGLAVAFFINRAWTFADSTKRSTKRIWLSLLCGYIGLFINTMLVWFLAHMIAVMLAKVLAVLAVLFYNYATNKYLIFRVS